MTFLYPNFLFALLAIAIPIIIHIFNLRSHKLVYYSNVQLLRNLKEETRSRSQLRQLLILLARILAIIAAVIAFAQPYNQEAGQQQLAQNSLVSVYIDNSYSMEAAVDDQKLLDLAKKTATGIVQSSDADARFLLLTNDLEARHQQLLVKSSMLDYIAEVDASPATRPVSMIMKRQQAFFEQMRKESQSLSVKNFLISDYQKNISDFHAWPNDSLGQLFVFAIQPEKQQNIVMDTCWFSSPYHALMQEEELQVKISNHSDTDYENITVNLYLSDSLKTFAATSLRANESKQLSLKYTNRRTGTVKGRLSLSDYPIVYDNSLYYSYLIQKRVQVLSLYSGRQNKFLQSLFDDEYVEHTAIAQSNLETVFFNEYDFVILESLPALSADLIYRLTDYINQGGSLLIVPAIPLNVDSYNSAYNALRTNYIINLDTDGNQLTRIDYEHPLYGNVFQKKNEFADLPELKSYYVFSELQSGVEQKLLATVDNKKILGVSKIGAGKLYSLAVPLDGEASNFVNHLLFIPTFYNMALQSVAAQQEYYLLGSSDVIAFRQSGLKVETDNVIMKNPDATLEFRPELMTQDSRGNEQRMHIHGNIKEAGHYDLYVADSLVRSFAFNYNRSESDMNYWNQQEIEAELQKFGIKNQIFTQVTESNIESQVARLQSQSTLWRYFLLAALFFIAAEIALIRFWSDN